MAHDQLSIGDSDAASGEYPSTSEQHEYAELYRDLPAIAFVLDERGIILALSPECSVQFGAAAQRLLGRSILSLAHRADRDGVAAAIKNARSNSSATSHCEFRIWRGDVPAIALRASMRAANRSSGGCVLVGVCSDITDRVVLAKQLEERSAELNSMAGDLLVAQERERRRIANDMHDTVGHNLAMAKFGLDSLASQELPDQAADTVMNLRTIIAETIAAVRSLSFALDSTPVHDRGLDAAVEDFGQTLSQNGSLRFTLASRPRDRRLNQASRIVLFRCIRELLVNVAKHAQADNVRVSIVGDATHLNIHVVDDGKGFESNARSDGTGLRALPRHLEPLDGELSIRCPRQGGTEVSIRAPYSRIGGSSS